MADLLETASAWLDEQREKHLSSLVLYQRGSDTVEVPASLGRTLFTLDDGAGAVLRSESQDFLIRASHLVLSGQRVVPRRGDRIHRLVDGVTVVFEVLAPGDEPVWRYSDPYRRTLRIHTKQVDTEVAP